jgi:hypothetical protein
LVNVVNEYTGLVLFIVRFNVQYSVKLLFAVLIVVVVETLLVVVLGGVVDVTFNINIK